MCARALRSANGGGGSCLKTVKNWALEEGESTFEFEHRGHRSMDLRQTGAIKKGRRIINIQSECQGDTWKMAWKESLKTEKPVR